MTDNKKGFARPGEASAPNNLSMDSIAQEADDAYWNALLAELSSTPPDSNPGGMVDPSSPLVNTLNRAFWLSLVNDGGDNSQLKKLLRQANAILNRQSQTLPTGQSMAAIWQELGLVTPGIPTLKALQNVTPVIEYEPGLSVIAAPTSSGKTTFLVQQVKEWLLNGSTGPILFWSAETSRSRVWAKILANTAQLSMCDVLNAAKNGGNMTPQLFQAYQALTGKSERLIVLDETTTAWDLCRMGERLTLEPDGLYAVVIDYIQELEAVPENHQWFTRLMHSRELEVGIIARMLREFGHQNNVPVVAAAQFNRTVNKNSNYIPDLLQLRESGRIEQNAALVIGLRNETMSGADGSAAQHSANVAKSKTYSMWDNDLDANREGAMAAVRFEFDATWILEEAFILKNRDRGGVGTVIPFALHPESGRCEPLSYRLLPPGGGGASQNQRSTKKSGIGDQNHDKNDNWYKPPQD